MSVSSSEFKGKEDLKYKQSNFLFLCVVLKILETLFISLNKLGKRILLSNLVVLFVYF